jgi:hypothetical protein
MVCKSAYQRLARPVTKEWLEDHYLSKNLDCTQIGRLVNRDPKSVWNWLKDFGIPTRARGYAAPNGFKKGHVSPTAGQHRPESVKEALRRARKASPTLPHLNGSIHYLKGKRGAETPNWKGGCTPERQGFYSSREWKDAVIVVWQRDNAICCRCSLDSRILRREHIQFAIHHIESFTVKEKRADPSNLVLLCRQCHLWVHSKVNVRKEFLK